MVFRVCRVKGRLSDLMWVISLSRCSKVEWVEVKVVEWVDIHSLWDMVVLGKVALRLSLSEWVRVPASSMKLACHLQSSIRDVKFALFSIKVVSAMRARVKESLAGVNARDVEVRVLYLSKCKFNRVCSCSAEAPVMNVVVSAGQPDLFAQSVQAIRS